MYKFDYDKPITISANWRLTIRGDVEIFGQLIYQPNSNLRVIIEGSYFENTHPFHDNPTLSYENIYGYSREGLYINLYNCKLYENRHSPGYNQTIILFDYALISPNSWIEDLSQDGIKRIHIKLNCLQDLFRTSFKSFPLQHDKTTQKTSIVIDDQFKPIELFENDSFKIQIGYHQSAKLYSFSEEYVLQFQLFLTIEFYSTTNLQAAIDNLKHLRNFFSTIVSSSVGIENSMVETGQYEAEVIFLDPVFSSGSKRPDRNMILDYNKNPEIIKNALRFWIENDHYFKETGALYALVNYDVIRLAENKLVTAVFAIESFISFFHQDIDKGWPKNQKNLYCKLIAVKCELALEFDISHFLFLLKAKRIINYRNYLAHLTPKKRKPIDDKHIGYYSVIARLIYQSFVLKQIGIDNQTIGKIHRANLNFRYWLQNPPK